MAIEQIEYIIHKDGRVEEKVTGVKGAEVNFIHPHLARSCVSASACLDSTAIHLCPIPKFPCLPLTRMLPASDTVPRDHEGSREGPWEGRLHHADGRALRGEGHRHKHRHPARDHLARPKPTKVGRVLNPQKNTSSRSAVLIHTS